MNWNLISSNCEDETITNVFHKNHHFKLTPEGPLNEPISVKAIVRNHRIVVSVDNNLFLLENEDTIECNTVCFESEIDAIELSSSGLVVICALKCGDIHGLHIQGSQIFTVSVGDKDISETRTFVGISQIKHDYIFMCSTGSVYRLSNVDEHILSDITSFNCETTIDVSKTMSNVELAKVSFGTSDHHIETFCVIPSEQDELIVSSSKKYLFVQTIDTKCKMEIPKAIQSFKAIFNLGHYLVGVSSAGKMYEICLLTKSFRLFTESDHIVEDVVILQVSDNDIHLLLQTKAEECSNLKIVDFPSMKCHYELPIPTTTHLVSQSQSSVNLYYLEEILGTNMLPQEVVMNLITESQPAERLKKLIRIGRLDEAEVKQELIDEKQAMLLDLVKKMVDGNKNTEFLISLRCTEVTDKETIQKILLLLLENVDFANYEAELGDIKEQLLRLDTLELNRSFGHRIYVAIFRTPSEYVQTHHKIECIRISMQRVAYGRDIRRLSFPASIWNSYMHPTRWNRYKSSNGIVTLLQCIIQHYPETMSYLIDKAIDKMTYLQYLPDFPEIGITFINDNSIEENAFNILLRIHLNHLKDLAVNFLFPLFFEKGLLPSDSIVRYVKFLVKSHKNIGFWQERAVAVLDLIYNNDQKLECALSILRVAPVPWSDTVTALLKLGNSSHPLAVEIYNEYESQHLKMLKIKYGWEANSTDNILKLAFRIIKVDPDMVDDVRYLVKVDSTRSFAINSYYVTTLLQQNRIEKCFEFMNLLTNVECEQVLEFIINIQNDSLSNNEFILEFYKYCSQRVNDKTLLKIAFSRQKLQSTFQFQLTPADLSYPDVRLGHFTNGIKTVLNKLASKETDILGSCYRDVTLLCASLNFDPMKGIVELAKTLGNIHFTCGMAKTVLHVTTVNEHNHNFFIDLAVVLIGQQIKSFETDGLHTADNFVYLLASKLLERSLKHGRVVYREICQLISWCLIGCDIYSVIESEEFLESKAHFDRNTLQDVLNESCSGINDSFSVFESVRSPASAEKPPNCNEEVLKCLSLAIHLICTLDANPFERINKHYAFNMDDTESIKSSFTSSLNELVSKKVDIAYKIMHLVLKYQKLGGVSIIHDSHVKIVHRKIIYFGLQEKDPNFLDLIAVLMSDSNPKDLAMYLNTKLKNTANYVNFLKLGEACNTMFANLNIDISPGSIFKYQYYKELCKHDPSIQPQTNVDFQCFDKVLNALQNKVISVSLLKEMSQAFKWNYQKVLVTQILTILSSQELDYSIKTDVFGKEEIMAKNSVEDLCDLCEIYINELTSKDHLAKELLSFMKTINFYFYEIFLCVIHILNTIKAAQPVMNWWLIILKLMKHKMVGKRRNPIGQIENDTWLAFHPLSGVPPPISKYRIPFLLTADKTLEDILRDEVNVEDFDKWYQLIEIHAQMTGSDAATIAESKDSLCMLAVKNSLGENQNKFKEDSANYNFHPKNNEFLQSILRVTNKMSDKGNILSALHFTTKFAAEGADQVEAAYECYTFAINNEPELRTNRRDAAILTQIKRLYPIYKLKFLLRLYNLMDDKLNELVEKPEDLISELYEHESILKEQQININKLVEEVADLHNKNLKEIQMDILRKWFCDTVTSNGSVDETFCEPIDTVADVDPQNFEIITRTCYILSRWTPAEALDFCLRYLDQSSAAKKLLAFECYMKLSNGENEIFPCGQFIQIKCAYYLKQLGIKYSDQAFNNLSKTEKIETLKKIWKKYAHDPKAIDVIILISVGYDIYHPKLWRSTLKQMVTLKMTNRLSAIIELLSRRPELRQIDDAFAVAWQYLIEKPFECATKMRTPDQDARLIKSLFLCQTCPVVSKIDFMSIARQFVFLQRSYMAAALLVFANEQQRSEIKQIINASPSTLLKEDLKSLTEYGIYSFVVDFAVEELDL
ncbi:hypothetical protein HA402_008775 [Bradysia odoriphaga]|nr:hypothetical protein HA402_008775 [Bradysia odoriphaga]